MQPGAAASSAYHSVCRADIGSIQALQMKLAKQLLVLLFPLAARRRQYRIVRGRNDPFLQLQHPPELLAMADVAVHEKRASVATGRNAGWNVAARDPACRSIVHQISPGIYVPHPLAPGDPPERFCTARMRTIDTPQVRCQTYPTAQGGARPRGVCEGPHVRQRTCGVSIVRIRAVQKILRKNVVGREAPHK